MNISEAEKLGINSATKTCLANILANMDLNAVLNVAANPEIVERGELNVPYLAKDNLATLNLPTTASSKMLEGFISPYEATVIKKLREAGAVLVGKTNLDEFAMGSSTENSAFGVTLNPINKEYVPGGSSGGSAAAVAAGLVPFALGSDTGGSIRQPAAFCGVVGLMPTYGRVSRYGLLSMASSLDRIGPITTNVEDAARVLQVIAGHDAMDSTSVELEVPDYLKDINSGVNGLKIGIAEEFLSEGIDPLVAEKVRSIAKKLLEAGAEIISRDHLLPNAKYALATYYIIQPAEVSANLARYDGIRYGLSVSEDPAVKTLAEVYQKSREKGFGAEVKRRIMLGTYTLSAGFRDAYYDKAQRVRTLIKQDFDKAFTEVDAIISPTTPTVAFKIGERSSDPLEMYKADLLTTPANMAGIPAISIPCGMANGMPVGLQIMCDQFEEAKMLRIAKACEELIGDWK